MEHHRFRCRSCKKLKAVKVRGQRYCSEPACQKARKNAWRRQKYATDPDYRLNQKQSTQAWLKSQGGAARYYRRYRKKRRDKPKNKDYGRNLLKSIADQRYQKSHAARLPNASSDAISPVSSIETGRYLLFSVDSANSDATLVEIKNISGGYG